MAPFVSGIFLLENLLKIRVGKDAMAVTSRPGYTPQKLQRLTASGGDFISWSADSSKLRWLLGPQMFEVSMETIQHCTTVQCVEGLTTVYDLGFSAPTYVPQSTYIVTVHDIH